MSWSSNLPNRSKHICSSKTIWNAVAVLSTFVLKYKHWPSNTEKINECGIFTKWYALPFNIKINNPQPYTKTEMNFPYLTLSKRTHTQKNACYMNILYELQKHLYSAVKFACAIRSWVSGCFRLTEMTEKWSEGNSGC